MAIKSIDTIQIGGYPAGQFAGGYIYSMNMTQGYSEEINKLTMDVVFESSTIDPSLPIKNLNNSFTIKIGSLYLPSMHFISHTISRSVGQTTLSCTFADNSINLDRYYIGLYMRHGTQSQNNLIIVGSPKPNADEPCSVDDVYYKIDDVMNAISTITNSRYVYGYSNLLNYTGTIRQVLSNIGSDFGFSFYWDMIKNKLVIVDLKQSISLSGIESVVKNTTSIPIADLKEEETLEGTYAKSFSNFSIKNGGIKEVSHKEWSRLTYTNIPPNISNLAQCFLASVNPTLRTLYALSEARYTDAGVFGFNPFNAAGFSYFSRIFASFVNEVSSRGFPHVFGSCYAVDSEGEKAMCQLEANEFEKYGKFYRKNNIVTIAPNICNPEYARKITVTQWPGGDGISNPKYGSIDTFGEKIDFTRNANTTVNSYIPSNLDPLFLPVTDELANQLYYYSKSIGFGSDDFDLWGKTLIAFPKINVRVGTGTNPNEEDYQPAVYTYDAGSADACLTCAKKSSNTTDTGELSEPGKGLNSKRCVTVTVTTPGNGYLYGYLPSTDYYWGYVQVDVTESFNDKLNSSISQGSTIVPDTVMQYEHAAVDITNKENTQVQGTALSSKPLKNISFKIIGTDFSQISSYMNPESGLTNFSIYLDDNGIFSDFTFQSRPPTPPNSEIIMEKVSARKVSITG
jgi:hypothetical protein